MRVFPYKFIVIMSKFAVSKVSNQSNLNFFNQLKHF